MVRKNKEDKPKTITDVDLQYYINYDYDVDTNCEEAGCDYICRCRVLTNARVASLTKKQRNDVADKLIKELHADSMQARIILDWCLDQMTEEDFNISIINSYYGEEVSKINLYHNSLKI